MQYILPPFLRTLPRLRIPVHAKAQQIIALIEDLPRVSDIEVSPGRREPSLSPHIVQARWFPAGPGNTNLPFPGRCGWRSSRSS
jgi:hypothetical protein